MRNENASGAAESKETDLVLKAFRSLPSSLKVAVLSIVLIALAVLAYFKFFHADKGATPPSVVINNEIHAAPQVVPNPSPPVPGAKQAIQSAQGSLPYTGGTQTNAPENANSVPQNIEAEHESGEDGLAAEFHLKNLTTEIPKDQTIAQVDPNNYIHYKFFSIDRCIWLNRREAGVDHWQWIKDPQFHTHDVHKKNPGSNDHATSKESMKENDLTPTETENFGSSEVHASRKPRLVNIKANLALPNAVQGNCLNPHPGQFVYWWGPPFDQCNSPLNRQFPDGCTHYQIYNRCANAWDARIFWTNCVH